ncbi:hypothetical protein GSI_02470 [Ganoderma sinense ZZ0214-1]|uniref:XPG-I domain-containing protein n=1 Tax=Ganoderma sinense ZZ0214-1 TaxID=1077348 RepID=A0A2G8SPR3_9APHY|nr:hypothetical protein GSI_02448 [Ganoderma sinense ZZ0214-1]PIL35720.1 hypothetical protein GSI_02450 [Ganoderma sinense ZZ0214-1]PIL35738.1 hypothetical protein GSI_02468 [Ganoderma sinense ZZ0214-1]PIL35740.1 hypothetical protein GSI_02470 [Ganoderma sinense ZZ0214-1]
MGIEGLWKVVEPAMERVDFTAFLINHVPPSPPNRRGYYRLGVDVSIWLRQCCAPFQRAHAQAGQNPELRTFYYRLVDLFVRPVAVVFVVDGPGRPTIKRGTRVIPKPHWLTAGAKDLVDAFGFDWIEALGEAEAELASMNAQGVIDGVMSDDSDALVFGARIVIRNLPKKKSRVKVDTLSENKMPPPGDLLLVAVLAGSDYSKGLEGCGIKTALGLARYGLGTSLLSQAWDAVYTGDGYRLPLDEWRDSLRYYLHHDPDGYVGRQNVVLAASVADDFPDIDVVMAHVRPLTTGGDCIPLDAEFGRSARFRVARIGQLCDKFFSWDAKKMADKMVKSVWPGVVMRLLGAEKHGLDWAEHQISKDDCNLILDSIESVKTRTRTATGHAKRINRRDTQRATAATQVFNTNLGVVPDPDGI